MDIKQQKDQRRTLAVGVLIILLLLILSLVATITLVIQNQQLTRELIDNKQTIISPMVNVDKGFSFIGERGDARYLRAIGLSMANLRFNVSSQNVEQSHEILIGYASEEFRPKLIEVLSREKKVLNADNGASTFYPKRVQVSTSEGIIDLVGELKFYYGIRDIEPIKKHYRLRIETRNSRLEITDFVELLVE